MITLVELSDDFKNSWAVGLLFFESTLDLAFFDDVKVISFVSLMEDVFATAHLDHFQTVDQFKFLVLLEGFEELDFLKVL